jgi:FdhD protein
MDTLQYQAIKAVSKNQDFVEDTVVVEAALQININEEPYTVVMRTPGSDFELIRGLLFAEDIYKKKLRLNCSIVKEEKSVSSIINCSIPLKELGKGYLNKRTLLSVSSCGICGKQELKDIELAGDQLTNIRKINNKDIQNMQAQMQEVQATFHKSGGSHAAAVFDEDLNMLCTQEDIGRHNAVDKCVGSLLHKEQLEQAQYLLVSGRVSYEIISKAFFAKIPIVIAVSACSSLAIDFAKEFGICLIGFSRDEKMTIYANPQYISL